MALNEPSSGPLEILKELPSFGREYASLRMFFELWDLPIARYIFKSRRLNIHKIQSVLFLRFLDPIHGYFYFASARICMNHRSVQYPSVNALSNVINKKKFTDHCRLSCLAMTSSG